MRRKFLILIALANSLTAHANPQALPAETKEPELRKIPGGAQVQEMANEPGKNSGDTYNFYFQKSPGTNKVQQGGGGQSVEQAPNEESPPPPSPSSPSPATATIRNAVVDLSAGLKFMAGKSASGLGIGAEFLPHNWLGAKIELFTTGTTKGENSYSSFSAMGTSDVSTRNTVTGGSAALALNVFGNKQGRIGPQLGFVFFNDTSTTINNTFSAFGSNDESKLDTHFHLLPYLGLSGTVYLSEHLGLNVAVAVPTLPRYTSANINIVFSI